MRWTGHETDMGEKRNTSTFVVRRPQGQTALERLQCRMENNLKVSFTLVEGRSLLGSCGSGNGKVKDL
jgi:hypothetical protein